MGEERFSTFFLDPMVNAVDSLRQDYTYALSAKENTRTHRCQEKVVYRTVKSLDGGRRKGNLPSDLVSHPSKPSPVEKGHIVHFIGTSVDDCPDKPIN